MTTVRFVFAATIFVAFGALLTLGTVAPAALQTPIIGAIPLSLVLTAGLIVLAVVTTGIYVLIANRYAP